MKLVLFILAACPLLGQQQQLAVAPGALNPAVTQENLKSTVCAAPTKDKDGKVHHWIEDRRPPVSFTNNIKYKLMKEAGIPLEKSGLLELDHRQGILNSGAPDKEENLQLQWWVGPNNARMKDRLEVYEHRQLCAGKITLAQIQAIFAGDYWAEYDKLAPSMGWPNRTGK